MDKIKLYNRQIERLNERINNDYVIGTRSYDVFMRLTLLRRQLYRKIDKALLGQKNTRRKYTGLCPALISPSSRHVVFSKDGKQDVIVVISILHPYTSDPNYRFEYMRKDWARLLPISNCYSENKRIKKDDKKDFVSDVRINYLNNGYKIKSIEKYRYSDLTNNYEKIKEGQQNG